MTAIHDQGPEPEGDDIVAAEYVLGVLPAGERQAAARRVDLEPVFARLVETWERHFAPFADLYAPVEPPPAIKAALDRRLFSGASQDGAARHGLWSSLAFWRGLSAAALAALIVLAALPFFIPPTVEPQARLVASLAAEGSEVQYLAVYDAGLGDVALARVSGEAAADRDYELWMIEGGQAPVSIGVIPTGESVHIVLTPEMRQKLAAGAVLAISLEPTGGSRTGQPTGPVVAAGDLRDI